MIVRLSKKYKVWIFPVILLTGLCLLTAFKISGSSIGFYNTLLYKDSGQNESTLLNKARGIRSDEWEVVTPLIIAQSQENFPRINPNIGNGQDMSVALDVPYKDWSMVFKPQNLIFFVLPVEQAFAFKWWSLAVILMLSCYYFCLYLLPRKYLFAILASVFLFFSPFIHWWYQTYNILPIAFAFLLATLSMQIIDTKSLTNKKRILLTSSTAYVAACFGLILYIPFIVPIGLVIVAFLTGHIYTKAKTKQDLLKLINRFVLLGIALLVAAFVVFGFLITRQDVINRIQSTVYPGHRVEKSGHFDFTHFYGGSFSMQLQDDLKASHNPLNQSEASNFILIFPALLPVTVYFLIIDRKKGKTDWRILSLLCVLVLFLARLLIPSTEFFFSFLQFNRIPHTRLLIGIGLLDAMLSVLVIQRISKVKNTLPRQLVTGSSIFAFILVLSTGLAIRHKYQDYLGSSLKIIFISFLIFSSTYLFLKKRIVAGMVPLLILALLSTVRINPLYRGLSPILHSDLSTSLRSVGDQQGRWIVSNDVVFENIIAANGLRSLSGVYAYPQLSLWEPLKKSQSDIDIYNRYAHVFFSVKTINTDESPVGGRLNPPALDAFQIDVDPCASYLDQMDVSYILTSSDESAYSCLKLIKKVPYPALTWNIYQIKR